MDYLTVCDKNDDRKECGTRTKDNYVFDTLPKKTFDMFNDICSNLNSRAYFKMDFDVMIDKEYMAKVIRHMVDNSEKRIYFGDPMTYEKDRAVAMNGKIYGMTRKLMSDYCKCGVKRPNTGLEDIWFGFQISDCVKKKFEGKVVYSLLNVDNSKLFHKNYTDKGVRLQLGRFVKRL
ncbi:hypothetical protein BB559_004686 [Furculomyces boomerangus]|uniref:Hexosyltransferase n=2 Tax=Harpellales TaxID=61421 RepID=A0A2T9YDA6_9FUNG|nr:hypothetical protein BB559_004686 [Furculomyces boomerangus]PWA01641.1 hypothetical protein BB558_002250 [Smittium angustum]